MDPFPDGPGPKVAVLGGGVAGMSAAHELIERGFRVVVFEKDPHLCGGKARSMSVPVGGPHGNCSDPTRGRDFLPGEHGFRFFPRFYEHITDTMSRIPLANGGTVLDNLVDASDVQLAVKGIRPIELPARFPRNIDDIIQIVESLLSDVPGQLRLERGEISFFAEKLWQVFTSCDARRANEYEKINWWQFIEADTKSEGYKRFLGEGLVRSLVAADPHLANAHVEGDVGLALITGLGIPGPSTDRVLNGPTNEAWLYPWYDYLKSQGVKYLYDMEVTEIGCVSAEVDAIGYVDAVYLTDTSGRHYKVDTADYYIAALPAEVMANLVDSRMLLYDSSLEGVQTIGTHYIEWMNGIQFFLKTDVPLVHGHTIYIDSPWALTSISQQQFWDEHPLPERGTGDALGVISVDISNWWARGGHVTKPAAECTAEEIMEEVWSELLEYHANDDPPLDEDMLLCWFLDPDITFGEGPNAMRVDDAALVLEPDFSTGEATDGSGDGTSGTAVTKNSEPLFVANVNTWALRPEVATRIPNLLLASDYVRTFTSIATMEAANEAARRAVNIIVERERLRVRRCEIWKVTEPTGAAVFRAVDRWRYERGLPWQTPGRLVSEASRVADVVEPVARSARRTFLRV